MRVLTTSLCYPTIAHPDQGVFIQRRAVALAGREGVDVRVASPQLWCPLLRRSDYTLDAAWPLPASYPSMLSIPVLGWATDGLAYAHALEQYIARCGGPRRFDLIDAHFVYPDGVGAWLAGRKLGIPVAVTVRGKIVSLSKKALRRMQIGHMLRGVDARIAVSRSLAGWVHRIGGEDLDVDIIPNGVDPGAFCPIDRTQARVDLGWDPNVKYLLAVGHLQRVKGFDRIVAAMPEIRARLGDVRLVLAGSRRGEWGFRHRLRRLISTCGGQPVVTFTGPVSPQQLNIMYNAADIAVNVSRSEGWNNAITEAMSAGTPVVAVDVGGNAEQICSPQLGRIVPENNPGALVDGIVKSLQTSWNHVLIAAHAGARTWNAVARDVQDVFERVLAARSRASVGAARVRLFGTHLNTADATLAHPAWEVNR